jgi:hypothetical protein
VERVLGPQVLRHHGGRIAEENRRRSPVSGSMRRSLTRGAVTSTAPALVSIADEANHFHPSRPNCSAGMPLARRGARAPPCHRCPRSRARRRGCRRGARAAGWRARAAPAARWARAASALRRRGPGPRSGREVGVPHRPGAERHHCFGRLGRQVRDDRDRFDQLEEAAGGGVRHPRTGRRHAGAPSGGCSSTRGLYSTSWMRPSKVRCSIISRATSG